MNGMARSNPERPALRHLSASFNNGDLQSSALRLIFALFPEWEHEEGEVKFTRFTDGITNTLLKASKRRPGRSDREIDNEAILIRAYGKGSEVLIDRERETASHLLLASYELAPELLARFQNGMIYRFIPGKPCSPADLRKESIWRGVATRLGQWHAKLPVLPTIDDKASITEQMDIPVPLATSRHVPSRKETDSISPNKLTPNIWTTMQKWIYALPTKTEAQKKRQHQLQQEIRKTAKELANLPGLGQNGLVLGHCDLLSGNVIKMPRSQKPYMDVEGADNVTFIDYEYASLTPAAFDLANHFAEWGGFDCDYTVLPTRDTRRAFLSQYLSVYLQHQKHSRQTTSFQDELDNLCAAVDRFRGIPGLYWGIWGLIQAEISQIDFDYAAYAEIRLGEYFAWREENDGSRARAGKTMHPREKRLAE